MSTKSVAEFDIKDIGLAADGKRRIEWAEREMPVLPAKSGGGGLLAKVEDGDPRSFGGEAAGDRLADAAAGAGDDGAAVTKLHRAHSGM